MNGSTATAIPRRSFGETMRADLWWIQPLLVFIGLSTFIVYSTWAAFQGKNYYFGNYVSPFYSPELFGNSPHSWFGPKPAWWPGWLIFSPALFILWAPGGFRLTCYYYRGAYYKAFWADPPACTVGEPRKSYWGERSFPLIMQNVHRYFLYLALLIILILAYDVWKALWFVDPATGKNSFGIGVGTIVHRDQRVFAWRLHVRLPLAATSDRRFSRSTVKIADLLPRLRLCHLPESPPHALGVDESLLGRFYRSLCAPLRDGNLARLANRLTVKAATLKRTSLNSVWTV